MDTEQDNDDEVDADAQPSDHHAYINAIAQAVGFAGDINIQKAVAAAHLKDIAVAAAALDDPGDTTDEIEDIANIYTRAFMAVANNEQHKAFFATSIYIARKGDPTALATYKVMVPVPDKLAHPGTDHCIALQDNGWYRWKNITDPEDITTVTWTSITFRTTDHHASHRFKHPTKALYNDFAKAITDNEHFKPATYDNDTPAIYLVKVSDARYCFVALPVNYTFVLKNDGDENYDHTPFTNDIARAQDIECQIQAAKATGRSSQAAQYGIIPATALNEVAILAIHAMLANEPPDAKNHKVASEKGQAIADAIFTSDNGGTQYNPATTINHIACVTQYGADNIPVPICKKEPPSDDGPLVYPNILALFAR